MYRFVKNFDSLKMSNSMLMSLSRCLITLDYREDVRMICCNRIPRRTKFISAESTNLQSQFSSLLLRVFI